MYADDFVAPGTKLVSKQRLKRTCLVSKTPMLLSCFLFGKEWAEGNKLEITLRRIKLFLGESLGK